MSEKAKPEISQELYRSVHEDKIRRQFVDTFKECPIPDIDILNNLGLFISSKNRFLQCYR